MDGLDLETIDKLDQSVFNQSPRESDEEEDEVPVPDCIGIDSALQDDEQVQLARQQQNIPIFGKTRSEIDRELELKLLKPDSIRRQILEKSIRDGNNKVDQSGSTVHDDGSSGGGSHVMNIVEKAGMQGIDKDKINEIIHEASKGSLFYKKQAKRQEEIHNSIQKMLNKVKSATSVQESKAKITCDKLLEELSKQRVFNRIIVHFDLDMFFAAVEIRDNPELADKPIAVGGDSMVSTSNYVARKYGVRAAMPGFIARKLCPDLILIKPNGAKYRHASEQVFNILSLYDPELAKMSLDEAYLDLTDYVRSTLERDGLESEEHYDGTLPKVWWARASEVVQEIREAIYAETKLTCSAGLACNTLLAKISTDINKPKGQFMVEGYPADVKDFISKTPVGKVSGIGKVSGQFLNALDIKTCGDIYEKRHFLPLVFYEINVRFYLRVALGDGSTSIKSDDQRKSHSVERTFANIKEPLMLLEKLDSICEELCARFVRTYKLKGRTITVKLKRNTFTTTTKSFSLLVPTNDKSVIYSAAKNLLLAEIAQEPPEISYRLLGVKLSNLTDDDVDSNQLTIDAMLRNQELRKTKDVCGTIHQIAELKDESILPIEGTSSPDELSSDIPANENDRDSPSEDSSSERGHKRKEPTSKRIEEFFSTQNCKRHKSAEREISNGADEAESHDLENINENIKRDISELNIASESELRQNEPNDEDFRCPYCFKPFSDFNILETHVDRCYLKTSIDVYKPFFSQKPKKNNEAPSGASQNDKKSDTKPSSTQPVISKKRRNQIKNSPIIELLKSNTSKAKKPDMSSQQGESPKVSFYEKFIQSNSQNLVRSPKTEPLQCPYCMHGYLTFESLESHVSTCIKNKDL